MNLLSLLRSLSLCLVLAASADAQRSKALKVVSGTPTRAAPKLDLSSVRVRAKATSPKPFQQDWGALKKSAPPAGTAKTSFNDATTEPVQRAMSHKELANTQKTGLLRGGREGDHYVSNAVNNDALRARQRLALGNTPEVKADLRVAKGAPSPSTKVQPKGDLPGGGTERVATGNVPVIVKKVTPLTKQ